MLVSILGSLFAGGATGLLGVLFQRFFDWMHEKEVLKQKQADQEFELAKRKLDIEITTAEWNGRVKVAPFVEKHPLSEINHVFEAAHAGALKRRAVLVPAH